MNIPAKSEVPSFSRSWDNSDCSFGVGLRTPNLRKEEAVRGRGWYRSKEFVTSYRPSIVTFPLSLCVSEILPLVCSSTPLFPTPPLVSPKLPNVLLGVGGWPLGYEERRCCSNWPCNYFPRFPTYVILIHCKFGRKGSVGISRDWQIFWVPRIISGMGKAANFKFCTHIHRIDRNKSPLKISANVAVALHMGALKNFNLSTPTAVGVLRL